MSCGGNNAVSDADASKGSGVNLDSANSKISYALGAQQIEGLIQQQLIEYLDFEAYVAGFEAAFKGDSLKVSFEEAFALLQQEKSKPFLKNKELGDQFLAENGQREEVTTLPSGLQYEVITAGTGPKPGLNDQFVAHYTGSLIDGTVFDSSVERGEPLTYMVNQVVPGWTEALQLMSVGSKWKIYLPSELAYGETGTPGGPIEPYSALIFEMELLDIGKPGESQ
ncbi:MAG TPA: peptidylprolyl isomerase [Flavobacteriales bacterium]|nr:peptidylprolyl isomerase [Flavobacteriales bacterium]